MQDRLYHLLLAMPVFASSIALAGAQPDADDRAPGAPLFSPVSYEDVYGAARSELDALERMRHCAALNEMSAESLHEEIAALGGAYELKRINGHYVVLSTGVPPEGLVAHANHLDVPLSLSVKDATVWEALKELNLQMAAVAPIDATMRTTIHFVSPKKPDGVWSTPSVTVEMKSTSARKILLEIIRQADIPLAYHYVYKSGAIKSRPFSYAQLTIYVYNEWGDMCAFETKEGYLIPFVDNHAYRGKVHEPVFDGALDVWVRKQYEEANKAFEAAMSRLEDLPELPKE
ncbi:MAG: hypothetical protein IT365_01275 [Candidatus Hydrogenedentes bacterium]|nr:hypothetical protein [Candidatus Hydrogenedentota bacterium]